MKVSSLLICSTHVDSSPSALRQNLKTDSMSRNDEGVKGTMLMKIRNVDFRTENTDGTGTERTDYYSYRNQVEIVGIDTRSVRGRKIVGGG